MTVNINDILKESRLFQPLSDVARAQILSSSRTLNLQRDQLLFSKGDEADTVYVVLSGEIAIEVISEQGRVARVATLHQGEVIGELAVLDDGPRTADARAIADSGLLKVDRATFLNLIQTEPPFAQSLIRDLIGRLRKSNDQVENVSLKPLRARIALTLAMLGGSGNTTLKMTQTELAERVSATREKVNSNLQEIQGAGAIALHRGRIEIIDFKKLNHLGQDS